jgi:AcrR family transcriptional regulator
VPNRIDSMRKTPIQNRGRQTMDDLFEAAAQLLDKMSPDEVNTNRIADRAGFSIGTLYSYFPNKASLLREMALRELRRFEASFEEIIETSRAEQPDDVIRQIVRLALTPLNGRHRVRRKLVLIVGQDPAVQAALHQAIDRMTDRFLVCVGIDPNEMSRTRRFLIFRSVLGPIRAAALHSADLLALPEFEDDLVRVSLALLRISAGSPAL